MKETSIKSLKLAAIAGIIAPILFVGVFTIEGWLRPGYTPIRTFVSALSIGSRGLIQITNFLIFGVLFLFFARAVATEFKDRKASQAGPTLITIFSICLFFSGPFIMDPMGTTPSQISVQGTIHGILGGIAFLIMPVSCFVFLSRFRKDPTWNSFVLWTLIISLLLSATLALFIFATKFPIGKSIFHASLGLLQRMVLVPYMFWIFTYALAFYKKL
jgi:Protein of unknown function (DUF998)